MRKISEMYKRSGGTSYMHNCSECRYFKDEKIPRCVNYELDAVWNGNWIACKFYDYEEENQLEGQMNIFDLMGK